MKLNKFIELYNVLTRNVFNFYLNNPISEKIRLQRIDKHLIIVDINKVKEIVIPHYIEKNKVFIDTGDNKIDMIFNKFLKIMNENFPEENLKNLYDNIIWVLFKKHNFFKYAGDYDPTENLIRVSKDDDLSAINHELLHLASNSSDEKYDNIGFNYNVDNYIIGYGLNEGYTELLNKRYFDSKTVNVYKNQIICCKYLEKIIGQKYMEKMYLDANLFGIIKKLKEFFSLVEIERFISAVDFTHDYDDINKLADCEIETFYAQLETIIIFLFKGYCKILSNQYYDNNTLEYEISKYIDSLINDFEFPIDEFFIGELNLIIEKNLNKNIKLDINSFKERKNVL